MKSQLVFISVVLIFCFSCKRSDSNSIVVQNQYNWPVLKSKEFNNVLELIITNSDTLNEKFLKEVVINTRGTSDLNDIESAALYYNGEKAGTLNETSILISETDQISSFLKLKCDFTLKPGKNFFWISYRLSDNADLLNRIGGQCDKVLTNKGEAYISMWEDPKELRIGAALRKHDDDNVHTYRIPGLVTTNRGTLLAVYDAR
jgi:sialidase-1